jgi:site-specific recombinase XerD
MRHSAATSGPDEGTAMAVVQELLGHSDVRVTRGYTHVSSALAQTAPITSAGPCSDLMLRKLLRAP